MKLDYREAHVLNLRWLPERGARDVGKVSEILVREGQTVSPGALLCRVRCPPADSPERGALDDAHRSSLSTDSSLVEEAAGVPGFVTYMGRARVRFAPMGSRPDEPSRPKRLEDRIADTGRPQAPPEEQRWFSCRLFVTEAFQGSVRLLIRAQGAPPWLMRDWLVTERNDKGDPVVLTEKEVDGETSLKIRDESTGTHPVNDWGIEGPTELRLARSEHERLIDSLQSPTRGYGLIVRPEQKLRWWRITGPP